MHSKRTCWPVFSVFSMSLFALVAISRYRQRAEPAATWRVSADSEFHRRRRRPPVPRGDQQSPLRRPTILPTVVSPTFANLPAEQDGMMLYCKDCKRAAPCVGGGSGAWARGNRGIWSCAIDALEASINANGNKITSLANGTDSGDAALIRADLGRRLKRFTAESYRSYRARRARCQLRVPLL